MPAHVLTTQRFPDDVVAPFADRLQVDQGPPGGLLPYAELLTRVHTAQAVLPTSIDRVDGPVFDAAPDLKVVANVGVGYNHIDVAEATRRGIWVTNTPGVLTETTADQAFTLLLGTLRRISEASEHVRHGNWTANRQDTFWGDDPRDLTLGIYGMGAIGQAFARRALPFGFTIIYTKRQRLEPDLERVLSARYVSFDELIAQSDVISIHVPLTDETRNRFGRDEFGRMKHGVYIVNSARGAIIDEAALVDALTSGQVAGVGLDVTATEPDVPVGLREHPRALITPHIASATRGTRGGMMRMALDNAAAILGGGQPINPVNQL